VHLALQHLLWRPPEERTLDNALGDLTRATEELATDPDIADLELSDDEWAAFHADAEVLLRRYFDLEDPRDVRVLGLELRLTAETKTGVVMRGIIDRLELDDDGELVVTDYKTGSAPMAGWEQKRLDGVHIYSVMCERIFGRRPARVQLLYLSTPERILTVPTDTTVRGVEVKAGAVMNAVRTACTNDSFRAKSSALCNFCSFQEFCPEFGGNPDDARPTLLARQAEREGRPQLPLPAV